MTEEIPAGIERVECAVESCDRGVLTNTPDRVDKCHACRRDKRRIVTAGRYAVDAP